jgi:hypothetical protein
MNNTLKLFASTLLLLSSAMAEDAKPLSSDVKLKIRESELSAIKAHDELNGFMQNVQAQVTKMPEYQKLSDQAQKTVEVYTAAMKDAETKCSCKLDPVTLTATKPETKAEPKK